MLAACILGIQHIAQLGLTSEALAVPLLTSTARGSLDSRAVLVASYTSLTPWLSATRTTSPELMSMRATSTPAGKEPPPLFRRSSTSLQARQICPVPLVGRYSRLLPGTTP